MTNHPRSPEAAQRIENVRLLYKLDGTELIRQRVLERLLRREHTNIERWRLDLDSGRFTASTATGVPLTTADMDLIQLHLPAQDEAGRLALSSLFPGFLADLDPRRSRVELLRELGVSWSRRTWRWP